MDNLFSLILDGVVLVLLIGTMVFSARLSIYLKSFRDSRAGMDKLLQDLSRQIDHAEQAIDTLQKHARNTGKDLQGAVDDAIHIKDELQIMTEYGDKLAVRLEKALEKRSGHAGGASRSSGDEATETADENNQPPDRGAKKNMFAIRDIDYDRGETESLDFDETDEDSFSSEAEKELYNALKKSKAGGV